VETLKAGFSLQKELWRKRKAQKKNMPTKNDKEGKAHSEGPQKVKATKKKTESLGNGVSVVGIQRSEDRVKTLPSSPPRRDRGETTKGCIVVRGWKARRYCLQLKEGKKSGKQKWRHHRRKNWSRFKKKRVPRFTALFDERRGGKKKREEIKRGQREIFRPECRGGRENEPPQSMFALKRREKP